MRHAEAGMFTIIIESTIRFLQKARKTQLCNELNKPALRKTRKFAFELVKKFYFIATTSYSH